MPTITIDKEEIKEMINASVKESVRETVIELIKSKDENMLELIEDVALGMIMEEDKKSERQEDFIDGEEFRASLQSMVK